jgi:hypothetical protein
MSRNGSGTYNLPAGNPVVTATTITSTWANTTLSDIGTALTGSLAADGQTPATGNLNMNTNRIINVVDPTLAQDAATKTYVDTADTTNLALTLLKANNLSDVANATTSRTNLGLGSIATQAASAVAITGGTITGITDLTVADGGTGASSITANSVILGNGTSALSGNLVAPSTSGNVLTSNGTTWTSTAGAYALTSGTAQASTSGTSIDFTSIPSWVKRVTVMFNSVSTNGTSIVQIQLGSGSVQTTGYVAAAANDSTGTALTSGFPVNDVNGAAGETRYGSAIFSLLGSNTWTCNGTLHTPGGNSAIIDFAGGVTLSSALDRVRITTVNGTDTFDAGSINILYE